VPVAVCSTSNERAVSTIVRVMLGPQVAAQMRVFAGDIVPKKKPDPAIYLLAAQELGVDPARCAGALRLPSWGCRAGAAGGPGGWPAHPAPLCVPQVLRGGGQRHRPQGGQGGGHEVRAPAPAPCTLHHAPCTLLLLLHHPTPPPVTRPHTPAPSPPCAPAPRRCVVTKSSYTQDEDFRAADAVFDCIGDAGDERFSLADLAALLAAPAK
jgi:hypothetical protein